MKRIFVTRNGLKDLELRRLRFIDELKTVQGQKGNAAEVGGNVWHDNFAFEELVRQENILNKQLQDIRNLLDAAQVVSGAPCDVRVLQIGHIAHLDIEEEGIRKLLVGGFGESDLTVSPPMVEYNAPIMKPFFGHEAGHEATVRINGVDKYIILKAIELK